ncbi:GAF domain-containing protein [Umezawaea beigongshangensis]|uniref:GAF domain-containing protein n=1 Tax=Umezawaea beigongshangensis TaxID=2780383 RepID=UPI0027DAE8FE|nr:GAF domain-containing protein [Umezawaea beigongshangensis]
MTAAEADSADLARTLRRLHERVLSGDPGRAPRSVISESWRRSLAARVDPDRHEAPLVYGRSELVEVRRAHPLAAVLPVLRETLVSVADDAQHLMLVTDAEGSVLWCEGASAVRSSAERVQLAEGAGWSEEAIGTNAMGTALAVGRSVTVHSAEHLVRTYHGWTCAASPVRDPDTGTVLGVVDVSGPLATAHPTIAALVSAAARLAEGQLQVRAAARDEQLRSRNMRHLLGLRGEPGALLSPTGRVLAADPHGVLGARVDLEGATDRVLLDDGREALLEPLAEGYLLRMPKSCAAPRTPVLSLSFLGGSSPTAVLNGRDVPLTLRHAELLTALVLRPSGLTAEQLALQLYGERGNPTTVRAELHRLRAQLGAGVLHTRPYRLQADVQADFLTVRRALRRGEARAAATAYRGALLPRSEAPVVRAEREDLVGAVRRAVLARADAEAVWAFAQTDQCADDVEVLDRLVELVPRADPRHGIATARLLRALEDD